MLVDYGIDIRYLLFDFFDYVIYEEICYFLVIRCYIIVLVLI